jgi:hypothetical protein
VSGWILWPLERQGTVTTHTFHVNIDFADRRLQPRTRADAARARVVDSVGVGAPRAVQQIRKQLGQAGAHSTEFCTLEMSSADGSDLHAHDGKFAAGPARYNSVMRGCKTTQPCSQPFFHAS